MIREIFKRIDVTNQTFVEFGVEGGLENNTLALLFDGWKGLWLEGSGHHTRDIRDNVGDGIDSGTLSVINSFVT